jgi:Uma2 family endonuclease
LLSKQFKMSVATISRQKPIVRERIIRRPKTMAEFLMWKPRDGFKYEWVNNNILKLPKMITPNQAHIVDNLLRTFTKTKAYENGDSLLPELKSVTLEEQVRAPDIAYVSYKERIEMANNKTPTPRFVIEIISKTDSLYDVDLKLEEYFKAGIQVLWHILPDSEKVYVYTSPIQVTVCKDNIVCSAESVIEGFSISAKAIFKKPSLF